MLAPKVTPTLRLMCAVPGIGKTTLAIDIEQRESASRLSSDAEIARRHFTMHSRAPRV